MPVRGKTEEGKIEGQSAKLRMKIVYCSILFIFMMDQEDGGGGAGGG